jgi:hypothetical protein
MKRKKGMNKRVKTIITRNTEDGATVKVRIEVTTPSWALTTGELDSIIRSITDDTMLSIRRAPYCNVPLSQMEIK